MGGALSEYPEAILHHASVCLAAIQEENKSQKFWAERREEKEFKN